MRKYLLFICLLIGLSKIGYSQPLRLAVAANAQFVLKALQKDFQNKTGIKSEIIAGSSGKLTAQIKNGAPYDLFLSADMDFPANLYKEGFSFIKPKVYALGSLIVCSTSGLDVTNWRSLLSSNQINKIAIANPKLAPYGKAAEKVLRHYQLWQPLQAKLIFGESVAQVNTYITTGAVQLGFTSEALLHENQEKNKFKWARVDSKVYPTLEQGVIVLNYAKKRNYRQAMAFYNYLSSPAAKQLLRQNGYRVP